MLFGYGGLSTETMDLGHYFDLQEGGSAAVLGYNYPGSRWYMDAYTLLTDQNVAPAEDQESWISRAYRAVF